MLEKIEALSKIVFAGIASTVLAYAGLSIEWKKLGVEKGKFCFDYADHAGSQTLQRTETIPSVLIKIYSEVCEVSQLEATELLNIRKSEIEIAESGFSSNGNNSIAQGYVALGKVFPIAYSQVNFDVLATGQPAIEAGVVPSGDRVLRARWTVNLRENTNSVTGESNAVLGVIEKNQCVRQENSATELRTQYWASVILTRCNSTALAP